MSTAPLELNREEAAFRAFLEPEEHAVGAITLRPITLATLSQLQQTKNEFLAPRGPNATLENELYAALAFGYIHAGPEKEVRRAVWSEAYFQEKVMEWGEQLSPADLGPLIAEISRRLQAIRSLAIAVQPKPDEGSQGGPTPPPNS